MPTAAPAVRMMLLEDADERGFAFQTNLDSPKARAPGVPAGGAGVLLAAPLRQVRVTGSD